MAGDGIESENKAAEIEVSGGASAGLVLRTGDAVLKADVKPARVKLRLTERDYDIFGFLLEQPFFCFWNRRPGRFSLARHHRRKNLHRKYDPPSIPFPSSHSIKPQ